MLARAGPGVSLASPWARATPHLRATNWKTKNLQGKKKIAERDVVQWKVTAILIVSSFLVVSLFLCFRSRLFRRKKVYALLNKTRKEEEMPFLNFVGTTFCYPLIFLHVYISYPSMNLRLLGPNWPSTYNGLEASGPPNPIQIHLHVEWECIFCILFLVWNDAGALTTKFFFFFDKHLTTKLL